MTHQIQPSRNPPVAAAHVVLEQARSLRGTDDQRAMLLFEQVITQARALGEVALTADGLNGVAGLEHARGQPQAALFHLEEALALREALNDQDGMAAVLGNIGAVHLDLGAQNTALEYLLRAEVLLHEATPARAASVIANLARTYDALNQPDAALSHYARAQELAALAGHKTGQAVIAVNQADLLRRQARYEEAETLLEQALAFTGRTHPLAASALMTLGLVRRDEGRVEEALCEFRRASSLSEDDVDTCLEAAYGEADALLKLQRPQEAACSLERALHSAQESGRVRFRARALALLAQALEASGDLPAALSAERAAHQADTDVLRAEAERRTRELQVRGELELAKAHLEREQGRYEAERAAKEKLAREQEVRLAELERLALFDALTSLPNRLLLAERARSALDAAAREGERVAVGVMDLTGFKGVNDTHGHHVGDLLLKGVAERLAGAVGPGGTVARTGGDEFVVLSREAEDQDLLDLAQRLLQTFDSPFYLDGIEVHSRTSVGFARYPDDGSDLDTLLERADQVMYRAKARGSGFDLGGGQARTAPATLEAALHGALRSTELHLLYQPLEDTTGRWVAAEALLRWRSPLYGNVTPDQFLPLAERSGLSLPLGEWTLEQVCSHLASVPELNLSVNLSARQLLDPALPDIVARTTQSSGVSAQRLTLEVQEETVARAPDRSRAALHALVHTGVHLTLDDFGAGFANFAELAHLPLQAVKLNRALVTGVNTARGRALLTAVVRLAQSLELEVIAKGVETEVQRDIVRATGVDRLQGFLVSAPVDWEIVRRQAPR